MPALAGTDYITPSGLASAVSAAFPFTPVSYGVATGTTIGFTGGLLSTASSTFTSTLHLPSLANGELGVNGGVVYSGATTTAGTGLSYSAGAFNVNTTQNITTLSNLSSGLVLIKLRRSVQHGDRHRIKRQRYQRNGRPVGHRHRPHYHQHRRPLGRGTWQHCNRALNLADLIGTLL